MLVCAFDHGKPVRSAEAQLIINVQRNQYPPVFDKPLYETEISESVTLKAGIYTIKATDRDLQGKNYKQFHVSILWSLLNVFKVVISDMNQVQ